MTFYFASGDPDWGDGERRYMVFMTREEAKKILGDGDVNAAFRRLSVKCHPDGPTPDPVLWASISAAKAVLLLPPPRCAACRGTGRVGERVRMFCDECGGKGYVH